MLRHFLKKLDILYSSIDNATRKHCSVTFTHKNFAPKPSTCKALLVKFVCHCRLLASVIGTFLLGTVLRFVFVKILISHIQMVEVLLVRPAVV